MPRQSREITFHTIKSALKPLSITYSMDNRSTIMNTKYYKITALLLTVIAILLAANVYAQNRRRPFTPPENITYLSNIPYADTDNPRQMLDLLIPKEPKSSPLPVIVFIHGGAWRAGSKESALWKLRRFAESGNYACVSINYRLTNESIWPTQIHDCKAAIRWIKANSNKYNLNPDKIGVWGSSAGGHLVAMLGTSADVIAMDGTLGDYFDISSSVACVVDFYGPTHFPDMDKEAPPEATMRHGTADSPESMLMGFTINENPEGAAIASPITYITPDDPPFLIVHGTKDPTVPYPQSTRFHEALNKCGVSSTLISVTGGGHGKGFGEEVNRNVIRFFDHHLRGIKSEWEDKSVGAETRR